MTSRDSQICEKTISEISVAGQLIEGVPMEDFINDERTSRAISMTLINVGELVKNLTPELKEAHTDIPWRAISGMRDITAHRYQTLRKEDVYRTCVDDLPAFEKQLQRLMCKNA